MENTSHLQLPKPESPPQTPESSYKNPSTLADSKSSRSSIHEQQNLFINLNMNDDLVEMDALSKGKTFDATYIVSESNAKFREVVLTVSLQGIVISEAAQKADAKKRSRNFDIEQILQYSYNRSQTRFTFAYLEEDGILTNYRFISKDFFEIHQSLGSAISFMVKLKSKDLESSSESFQPEDSNPGSRIQLASENLQSDPSLGYQQPPDRSKVFSEENLTKSAINHNVLQHSDPNISHHPKHQHEQQEAGIVIASGDDDEQNEIEYMRELKSEETTQYSIMSNQSESSDEVGDDKSLRKSMNRVKNWFNPRSASPMKKVGGKSITELHRIDESKPEPNAPPSSLASVNINFEKMKNSSSRDSFGSLTFAAKKFGSLNVLEKKRKNSVHDVFTPNADESSGRLNQTVFENHSVESMNLQKAEKLPAVDKKLDQWGREILIRNLKGGKYDITAGTMEALVDSLAEEVPPDTIYIEVFLLTFRHFMTPLQLVQLLSKRFANHLDDQQHSFAIIRLRVVSVIKKWAERHYYDFKGPEVLNAFEEFAQICSKTDCAKYASQIKSILVAELERAKTFTTPPKPVPPPEIEAILKNLDIFSNWSPKRIAQELTLVDLKLFRLIKPDEFCIFLWGDKNDPRIANFNAYVNRFNTIGFWVGSVITSQLDMKKRADLIEKIIQVMKYCHKYQNYNTLMALMSGLNMTAVSRLKKTWELVSKGRWISIYKELEAKMSYRGNFKAYREVEAFSKPPFIPFFGLYVKDLTFMNDGNQKHLNLPATSQERPIPKLLRSNSQESSMSMLSASLKAVSLIEQPDSLEKPLSPLKETQETEEEETVTNNPAAEEEKLPPLTLINFEKCRTISDKIHAIRIYQQSSYKFEDKEEQDNTQQNQHFFQLSKTNHVPDTDLMTYLGHPYGPPANDNEKLLLEWSRQCEPSDRHKRDPSQNNYVIASNQLAQPNEAKQQPQQQQQPIDSGVSTPTTLVSTTE